MSPKPDSDSTQPLTEATFFILLSLSKEPKHGYAIMKETSVLSSGRIKFSTGTLYGALKRLLDLGWIERKEEETMGTEEDSRIRKEYRLTGLGKSILSSEIARMEELVRLAASYAPEKSL